MLVIDPQSLWHFGARLFLRRQTCFIHNLMCLHLQSKHSRYLLTSRQYRRLRLSANDRRGNKGLGWIWLQLLLLAGSRCIHHILYFQRFPTESLLAGGILILLLKALKFKRKVHRKTVSSTFQWAHTCWWFLLLCYRLVPAENSATFELLVLCIRVENE